MSAPPLTSITLRSPGDFHLHLRDGALLETVVPHTAREFSRAIIMPNLNPPIRTVAEASAYRGRILDATGTARFEPLMTLYLTEATTREEIAAARRSGFIHGMKLYPAGATTNSQFGVTQIEAIYPLLEEMSMQGLPLLVHGEITDPDVDIFDRETVFIDRVMVPIVERFSSLKIVFEHVTTREAVQFVLSQNENLAATITAHHLFLTRNDLLAGGIRPHHYCLPVVKTEGDRIALLEAATSSNPKFFAGTDSAPHERKTKEAECGRAGIYTAPIALELYAEAFDGVDKLEALESFVSTNGERFYSLSSADDDTVTLVKKERQVAKSFQYDEGEIVPFRAGKTVGWSVLERGSAGRA